MDPATLTRLRVYGALLVVALGLYLMGRWQGAASVADAAAVRDAETGLAAGQAYRARLDSLRRMEHQQSGAMQAARHLADSLRRLATRTDTVRLGNLPDSGVIGLWRAVANAEREAGSGCHLALQTCQERAVTAEARATALDSLLTGVLKVRVCHIWFLRCPSRAATGLVGLGLGLTGGLLLGR
jgi:hypothetical protein